MNRLFRGCFLLALLILLAPVRLWAQDEEMAEFVRGELDTYYRELVKLDKQIVTAEDAERYETRVKNHLRLVESCYSDYSEVIRYDKKLYSLYEKYTDYHQELERRMESLKEEQARQEKYDKVNTKLNRYMVTLAELEEAGNRCVANKRLDSLNIIKKQAEECYVDEAMVDYGANRDFIEEDEDLALLWKKLKETYGRISNMQIVKTSIDMVTILEIVGIVAAVVLIFTMISGKIKAAKLTKPQKEKKPKKQEEDIPSI
jgi:hypothetical protein